MHPATQANLEMLRQRGVGILGPAAGHLASGLVGVGRMIEPAELLGHIRLALARGGPLAGRRVLVTAAGTQEPIDPVRAISNRFQKPAAPTTKKCPECLSEIPLEARRCAHCTMAV